MKHYYYINNQSQTEKEVLLSKTVCINIIYMIRYVAFLLLLQREHLKIAQQYFQLVGGSASECGKLINI